MKKILYIIPIILLSILLVNNVYGYTVSGTTITVSDINDAVNYINDNPFDSYSKIYDTVYDESAFEPILNSELFKEGIEKHPYYVMFNGICIFYDEEFSYKLTISDDRLQETPTYNWTIINMKPKITGDIEYFNYSLSSGTVSSTSLQTISMTSSSSNLTQSFIYQNDGKYYTAENILSVMYSNFDVKYSNGKSIIVKNPEFSFFPTYSENYESCNLKLDIINEPDYYTLEYAINSSSSEWHEFDNSIGVTVENNCLVIVRMLDENGDELFANSYNVAILEDMLSTTYFRVNFDNSQKSILGFTPILFNNASEQFDIYFSYNSSFENNLVSDGKVAFNDTKDGFWTNYTNNLENFLCSNGKTYYLRPDGKAEIILTFKIINKHTGVIALTRTFKFNLSYDYAEALESTTNGKNDVSFSSGAGSNYEDTMISNAFASLNKDSSLESIMSTAEESFVTFKSLFSILPGFVWAFIASILVILVALRIFGR